MNEHDFDPEEIWAGWIDRTRNEVPEGTSFVHDERDELDELEQLCF